MRAGLAVAGAAGVGTRVAQVPADRRPTSASRQHARSADNDATPSRGTRVAPRRRTRRLPRPLPTADDHRVGRRRVVVRRPRPAGRQDRATDGALRLGVARPGQLQRRRAVGGRATTAAAFGTPRRLPAHRVAISRDRLNRASQTKPAVGIFIFILLFSFFSVFTLF